MVNLEQFTMAELVAEVAKRSSYHAILVEIPSNNSPGFHWSLKGSPVEQSGAIRELQARVDYERTKDFKQQEQ